MGDHYLASLVGSNKVRLWTAKCACGITASGGYRHHARKNLQHHFDYEERLLAENRKEST